MVNNNNNNNNNNIFIACLWKQRIHKNENRNFAVFVCCFFIPHLVVFWCVSKGVIIVGDLTWIN